MEYQSFDYPLIIKEHHLDTFGHVNNATYLELLEEARWEFISLRGFDLAYIQKHGIGPTIVEFHLKFFKELRLRQKIIIRTQNISYEKKIGKLRQIILNENGETCFEAIMTYGLFDTKERKLVLPTKEWLHAIGFNENGSI
jgi:thioesterase-3